jgi:hypothetical protein
MLNANILEKLNTCSEAILEGKHYGVRRERSTVNAIFTFHQILEKPREFNLPACILFVEYETAHDILSRETLWQILREEVIPTELLTQYRVYIKTERYT